jgi:hypothetical protein
MPIRSFRLHFLLFVAFALPIGLDAQTGKSESTGTDWKYGLQASAGYFNFRNSLFVEIEPDPPGDLSDDWLEYAIKPWVSFEHAGESGAWFGAASWVFSGTAEEASAISGGEARSTSFDDLYLGWRFGSPETGQIEVAAGRYPYQIANGFLISDGYADGGSRGAVWTNPRVAWAPGARIQYQGSGHTVEVFYLERDDRPESDSDTRFSGINYEWRRSDDAWTVGASYMAFKASELAPQLDGADVWNFRLYTRPFKVPLTIEAEWAYEDNGPSLDATAWYVQPYWRWENAPWEPTLYYRFAYFEGDDPDTVANEDFDPLFPAFHDWGSWWQGEIAGEWFLSNSNLKTHMLRLHTSPRGNIGTGLMYFDYSLDQPGSYQDGVVSDDLAKEIDWYMDWSVNEMFTFSFVLARNKPGRAVEEAFGRTKTFKYAMVYLAFSY